MDLLRRSLGDIQTGVVDIHNLRVKLLIRYRQLFSQKSKRLIAVRTAYRRTLPGADGCWGKACEANNQRCRDDVSLFV